MPGEQDKVIRYKWNPRTETGFRLRFDARDARRGSQGCFQVEDWTHHVVMDAWGCASLDEALGILQRFIDIDVTQERTRLEQQLPVSAT